MSKSIKIAVNTRFLIKNKLEGIGYFTYETLKRITSQNPEIEFHFLFDRSYPQEFIFSSNIKPVVLFPQARHPFLWYWWFEWSVADYLNKNNFDLFLSPDGFASLRSNTKTVTVQHDLAFEHFPAHVSFLTRKYYQYFFPKFVNHSTRIATVSEFSKTDLCNLYSVPPDKTDVVYSAAKDIFHPTSSAIQKAIRKKYTGGHPYFVFVGSINPRKNIKNMLLAFDDFKAKNPSSTIKFLLAGSFGWQNTEMQEVFEKMKFKTEVIFLNRQPIEELVAIIGSAKALLYVSLFEGFGVPPLEGMKCEIPVITSSVSSIPEVCGNAAVMANPNSVEEISNAMQKIFSDNELCAALIEKGKFQATKFTWDNTAERLWNCCLKAING